MTKLNEDICGGCISLGREIEPYTCMEIHTPFHLFYGRLPDGRYRISTRIVHLRQPIYTEFVITSGHP